MLYIFELGSNVSHKCVDSIRSDISPPKIKDYFQKTFFQVKEKFYEKILVLKNFAFFAKKNELPVHIQNKVFQTRKPRAKLRSECFEAFIRNLVIRGNTNKRMFIFLLKGKAYKLPTIISSPFLSFQSLSLQYS